MSWGGPFAPEVEFEEWELALTDDELTDMTAAGLACPLIPGEIQDEHRRRIPVPAAEWRTLAEWCAANGRATGLLEIADAIDWSDGVEEGIASFERTIAAERARMERVARERAMMLATAPVRRTAFADLVGR